MSHGLDDSTHILEDGFAHPLYGQPRLTSRSSHQERLTASGHRDMTKRETSTLGKSVSDTEMGCCVLEPAAAATTNDAIAMTALMAVKSRNDALRAVVVRSRHRAYSIPSLGGGESFPPHPCIGTDPARSLASGHCKQERRLDASECAVLTASELGPGSQTAGRKIHGRSMRAVNRLPVRHHFRWEP